SAVGFRDRRPGLGDRLAEHLRDNAVETRWWWWWWRRSRVDRPAAGGRGRIGVAGRVGRLDREGVRAVRKSGVRLRRAASGQGHPVERAREGRAGLRRAEGEGGGGGGRIRGRRGDRRIGRNRVHPPRVGNGAARVRGGGRGRNAESVLAVRKPRIGLRRRAGLSGRRRVDAAEEGRPALGVAEG